MLGTVLLVLLILMLVGALPTWPYSRSWGYGPTGELGAIFGHSAHPGSAGKDLSKLDQQPFT